jgi:hypothetical protein
MARVLATLLGSSALALVVAAPASADHLPTVFGIAQQGPLDVSSSVLVSHRDVDMRGGWTNESLPCTAWRSLDVRVEILYLPRGGTTFRRFRERRIRPVQNCAEGGPNMGFTLSGRGVGLACPDGAWRPGRYDFTTWTVHRATRVRAIAGVSFANQGRC